MKPVGFFYIFARERSKGVKMLCKYVLTVDSISYDIPKSCIQNWDEIKFSRKRSGLEGITRTFTSKFQFVGEAYDLILEEYLSKYLASNASISVYTITDSHTYDEFFSCRLDFGSLTYDGNTVSINSIDDSVANIIKANKGTQYEYSVDEIKDVYQLYYDSVSMNYSQPHTLGGNTVENDASLQYIVIDKGIYVEAITYSLPLYISGGELPSRDSPLEFYDAPQESKDDPNVFVKALSDIDIVLNFSFEYYISYSDAYTTKAEIVLGGRYEDGRLVELKRWGYNKGDVTPSNLNESIKIHLTKGQALFFDLKVTFNRVNASTGNIYFRNFKFETRFTSRANPIYVDAIRPIDVLNRLLKSMNGGNEGIYGEIASGADERLDNCVILAAESIRGIPQAKLYTSYTKFKNWMETVFGFVPVINGVTVFFKHRDKLFSDNNVKDLNSSFSSFEYKVDSSRIYSLVRVGYDKQDYESMNGRDEFRFTTEYTTGIDITDNVLELISPYRADVYGIEFLSQKRGQDTTDSESDNDVFFVCASTTLHDNGGVQTYKEYRLIRSGWEISGVLDPETMFNTMYWQGGILQANAGYIGMFTKKLSYSSSDGNSDVVVNGIGMKDDFNVESGIITCGDVSFTTYNEDIPPTDDETIKILKDDLVYEGYIKEVSSTVERNEGVKYDLFVRSITKA